MKVIGLTGPSGAGKSTVLAALESLGYEGVDCDALYHRLLETSPALLEELTDRFGKSILDRCGALDRQALGRVVFADPQALAALNAVTHRHVVSACRGLLDRARAQGRPGVAIEAIALFESGLGDLCGLTIAVTAPEAVRLARIMARDGLSPDYARRRLSAQRPSEYYVNLCDCALENDGSKSPGELTRELQGLLPLSYVNL